MLTRQQMEQVINRGGSVLYNGRIIVSIEHLPSVADLAIVSGDSAVKAATTADLQAQIDQLKAEQAKLTPPKEADKPPKTE